MKSLKNAVVVVLAGVTGCGAGLAGARAAEAVRLQVKPDVVLNRIDEKVYGHFLEHIYHSCDGGLWGELVWNRSFEENGAGGSRWLAEGQEIAQAGDGENQRLVFGDPTWTDYTFTLEAKKTGGREGFLILFRVKNDQAFHWLNLGGWGNVKHGLERGVEGQGRWAPVGPAGDGSIEPDRWYAIKVCVGGRRIQAWLDGVLVADHTDDGAGSLSGAVGVGTWQTQARFRNLKVTAPAGDVLYEGIPEVAGAPLSARHWEPYGPGRASMPAGPALNGDFFVRIRAGAAESGLQQNPVCVKAGETYEGSLWAHGKGSIIVRLTDGDTVLGKASPRAVRSDGAWKEYSFAIKARAAADHATLQVGVEAGGEVCLDQVSLMPKSWRKNGGFRPDLLQAVKDLRPPVIRWPGGCFASAYRWKQGIGPQHTRVAHPQEIWAQRDVYSMGTDEFIQLCRRVGAEPIIVVNIGTPQWNGARREGEFDQEVLDWIEYCNGPKDSPWGRVRAQNGHPEPYNVKYWEIDNETWQMSTGHYAARVNHLAPLMRKADPSIELIACGSGGLGGSMAWNRAIIGKCADQVDYLSLHHYEDPNRFADGPAAFEQFIRATHALIEQSGNPRLKIYVSEWNAQSTDWRTGLYCGGILNAFERCGDSLTIGGPALFLRHVSATEWDNAFINFDHRAWFPAPNYVVMKLWRDHYQPLRIGLDGESGPLNIVATKSEDGKTVCIKAVNPTDRQVDLTLTLDAPLAAKKATAWRVAADSLQARNTMERPDAVRPGNADVAVDGQNVSLTLPAHSATVIDMERDMRKLPPETRGASLAD